ncbi:MAG: hypothetical protein H0V29_11150, partial [Thermoleophilaceae bacterium]|nr:hypothetical protein [Thermoleophilaceae bacterium]
AGHWLVSVAEFAPVLIFIGWLGYITLREKRRNRAAGEGPSETGR